MVFLRVRGDYYMSVPYNSERNRHRCQDCEGRLRCVEITSMRDRMYNIRSCDRIDGIKSIFKKVQLCP